MEMDSFFLLDFFSMLLQQMTGLHYLESCRNESEKKTMHIYVHAEKSLNKMYFSSIFHYVGLNLTRFSYCSMTGKTEDRREEFTHLVQISLCPFTEKNDRHDNLIRIS